nr:crosslink repair DNA glycosylase YcaQ family protein [Duganella sp. BJB1802]
MVGIHAARLITPYFALRSRLHEVRHEDIHYALHGAKSLIKARCMRGTLHLLPPHLFPHAHNATLSKRLSVCNSMYKKHGISDKVKKAISDTIIRNLQKGPLPSTTIPKLFLNFPLVEGPKKQANLTPAVVRNVVKELWERAIVCYINTDETFGAEQRSYGITKDVYPADFHTDGNEHSALVELLRAYILTYGPVSIGDIVWWSGQDKTRIKRALAEFKQDLQEIKFTEFDESLLIFKDDLEKLMLFDPKYEDWVNILAYEDPSLKGYFTTRARYVNSDHYDLLFNDIGEARPSIMLNGRIVGTWSFNKVSKLTSFQLFSTLPKRQLKIIESEFKKIQANVSQLLRPAETYDLFE